MKLHLISFLNLCFLNLYYSSDLVRNPKRYSMVLDDNKRVTGFKFDLKTAACLSIYVPAVRF
jgi:hypothetical protein